MIYHLEPVIFIGRVLLVIAAITTTAFPILYSFAPWYKSTLGRATMLQSVTLAAAILLKTFLTFFAHSEARDTLLWINVVVLVMIIAATSTLTYLMWVISHKNRKEHIVMANAPLITNRVYDVLKPLVTVILPGVSALYFTVAQIWGLPAPQQVVGTIAALTVFLGLLIGISSKSYNADEKTDAGSIDFLEQDGQKVVSFNIKPGADVDSWADKNEITFKINR